MANLNLIKDIDNPQKKIKEFIERDEVYVNVRGSSNSKKLKEDDNGWITHSGREVEDEFPTYSATHRFT